MRRILPLLLTAAFFLYACNPTVTLLGAELEPSPTTESTALPSPAARTPYPTPTRAYNLNTSPEALDGVEVLAWHGWDGASASLFEQMASEFNLSNKWGIKVEAVPQRNLNLLASAMDEIIGTPDLPDIVVALPEQILSWQAEVIDLTPYMMQTGIGLAADDLPAAFGEQSMLDGVRYGIPAARSARYIFYNISFAEDLGFSEAPQTSDEFSEQACAANAFWKQDTDLTNDGFGGLALDTISNWQTPYSWLSAGGGQIFSAGEFQFNTPKNVEAVEFVSKLREDDCAWLPDTASNHEHLAARRALFITGNLGDIADQNSAFSAAASPDKWTLLSFPGQEPGIVSYGPDYAVLKSNDSRQLAAWLFVHWMLEPQNQARWSRGTGLLPVTIPAIDMLKADGAVTAQWAAALDLIPQSMTYPQTAQWRLADKILADGFIAYFRNFPNVSLADVLDVMDSTVQDLTKK